MMFNYFMRARNSKKGFTIIELVIVIAIIGILSAVLIPNFSSVIGNADDTAKTVNLASINKIAATATVSQGNGHMLDVAAAVATNFGKETAAASMKNAAFNSETKTFTELSKVKVADAAAPDRNIYYPVYGETKEAVAAALKAYNFVTYKAQTTNDKLIEDISLKIYNQGATAIKNANYKSFTEVYIVNGSLALHSDVNLETAFFIFLDGASLETNGHIFKCHSVAFVDTSADGKAPVTFDVYGGNILPLFSFGVLNVSNFYADGAINYAATASFAAKTAITVNMGGTIDLQEANQSNMYLNVDNACAYVSAVITFADGSTFTIDGNTKLVVENGGTILPGCSQGRDMSELVSVTLIGADGTEVVLEEGSFVSLTINTADGASVVVDGVNAGNGITKSTVTPLTAQVAANYLTQITQAIIAAGGNMDAAITIVEKVGNSMVSTATAVSATLGSAASATAQALISDVSLTTVVNAVADMKTAVVNTAITSTANAATATVSSAIGTVTVPQVTTTGGATAISTTSAVSQVNSYSTCDTRWYIDNPDADTYSISTPQELYGLSSLVWNGVTSFYGKTIKLANNINLDAYSPWLPIGNGQYGFRGVLDGQGYTILNMHLDVNSAWVMLSLSGKGWNNTAYRTVNEKTAFGFQNGDKYAVGFIGVLENGGELKNVTFSNCHVSFDNNHNSYAAVAVGAVRATGEDYNYDGNGYSNAGKVITGFSNGIAVYGSEADASSAYSATGYKWNGSSYEEMNATRLSTKNGYSASTAYTDRAFSGWTTKITNVTVDESCSVFATGRCGGVCGVVAGAYYTNLKYNENNVSDSAKSQMSIFSGWGNVEITGCTNKGSVTIQLVTSEAYCEAGGIVGYTQLVSHTNVKFENCRNEGAITGGFAAGVLGNANGFNTTYPLVMTNCTSTEDNIHTTNTNKNGDIVRTTVVASSVANVSSKASTQYGGIKLT